MTMISSSGNNRVGPSDRPELAAGASNAVGADDAGHINSVDLNTVHAIHAAAPRQSAPVDPYAVIHQSLRGRYGMFTVLVLAGAAAGALAGWKFVAPKYESV